MINVTRLLVDDRLLNETHERDRSAEQKVETIGGFHSSTVGSQDYDLFLRLAERARAVAHLPRQLYSWRIVPGSTAGVASAKPYTLIATRRAIGQALARRRLNAASREAR